MKCKSDPRCDDKNLSAKARYLYCTENDNSDAEKSVEESTVESSVLEDDYYDEEFYRERQSFFRPEEPVTHVVQVVTTPNSFMDDEENPLCSDLMPGFDDMTNCRTGVNIGMMLDRKIYVFEHKIAKLIPNRHCKANS